MNSPSDSSFSNFESFKANFGPNVNNSFTLVNLNIRSLRKYWDEFKLLAEAAKNFVDAFILTEINVPEPLLSCFALQGYHCYSITRPGRGGGGIAVFVTDRYGVTRMDSTFAHAECLPLKLSYPHSSLTLLAVYRPPNNSKPRFVLELEDVLQRHSSEEHFILGGDLNIDTLSSTNKTTSDYLSALSSYGLVCAINDPTRESTINGRLVSSCRDHINVRAPNCNIASCVISLQLADHYFTACPLTSLSSARLPNTRGQADRRQRVITVTDELNLDKLVGNHNWSLLINDNPPNVVYDNFVKQLGVFQKQCQRSVISKRRKEHNWLTAEVMQSISHRDWLWHRSKNAPKNATLRIEYRSARNRTVALIRTAKRRYFQQQFKDSAKNPRKTWSLINTLRCKDNERSSLSDVYSGDPVETAELFNQHFIRASAAASFGDTFNCTLPNATQASAFLPSLSFNDLKGLIFSFRKNKPPGVDGVSIALLQRNFHALSGILLYMLNGFIETAIMPETLKTAVVKPLLKRGKKDMLENYRPISILPVLSQILEKFLLQCMTSFLVKFKVLSDRQFGFIAGKGTLSLLEEFADEIYSAFEKNLISCALFFDLTKAFDTLDHNILLRKLYLFGFSWSFPRANANFFMSAFSGCLY